MVFYEFKVAFAPLRIYYVMFWKIVLHWALLWWLFAVGWRHHCVYLSRYIHSFIICAVIKRSKRKKKQYISWAISFVILSGWSLSDGIAHHIFLLYSLFLIDCYFVARLSNFFFHMTHTETMNNTTKRQNVTKEKKTSIHFSFITSLRALYQWFLCEFECGAMKMVHNY